MKTPGFAGMAFILLTVFFTVTGQLLVKHGMQTMGLSPTAPLKLPAFFFKSLLNPFVFCGFSCAVLAALSWLGAISRSDLSFAYPFMGLAIVLTLALTPTLFDERIHVHQWIGVSLVVLGLCITSQEP